MFPYTEKYKEFESDIQNNDWLYKISQKTKYIRFFESFGTIEKSSVLFYHI